MFSVPLFCRFWKINAPHLYVCTPVRAPTAVIVFDKRNMETGLDCWVSGESLHNCFFRNINADNDTKSNESTEETRIDIWSEDGSTEFVINAMLSVANEIGLYLCAAGIMFTSMQAATAPPVISRHP
jgi:hypothetical protein